LYLKTIYAYYTAFQVVRIIKKEKIQLVLERSTSLGAGAIAAKLTHRPLVVEVIDDLWVPISIRNAKKILLYQLDFVPSWVNQSKLVKVYAAVNTRLFNPLVNSEKISSRYGLSNRRVIVYAGGFGAYKGVDVLIKASKDVLARHPESVFLMVGPDYQECEAYAKKLGVADHTIFTGVVPYEDVPKYLAAADILVAPYSSKIYSQGSPLKLFEYLALRKPVVASSIRSTQDVIKDGENGILVPPSDSKALAKAINKLLENPEYAKRIAEKGYESLKENYTWNHLAKTVEDCCKK